MPLLPLVAQRGSQVLILGLLIGLFIPPIADLFRPWLSEMVAVLLFLAFLRVQLDDLRNSLIEIPKTLILVIMLQLILPIFVLLIAWVGGWLAMPVVVALVFMLSAPSIVGSANICLLLGHDPKHALLLMISGTVLLPLTVLPIFWMLPGLGNVDDVIAAAFRLFLLILFSAGMAALVRIVFFPKGLSRFYSSIDGLSAIALALFVIALMPALADAALHDPLIALGWLAIAFVANIGMQIMAYFLAKQFSTHDKSVAIGIVAGNRNIALFLASLSSEVMAPILVFIACYQIPMYLTPLLLRKIYASTRDDD
jgi:hypothetical protein